MSVSITQKEVWEILVPKNWNADETEGSEIHVDHHRKWDQYVKQLAGGLTITKSAVGYWESGGEAVIERMIPVRIVCSFNIIKKIAEFTLQHYVQDEVLASMISDTVLRVTK